MAEEAPGWGAGVLPPGFVEFAPEEAPGWGFDAFPPWFELPTPGEVV